jgi:hypothetical protein
MLHMLRLRLRLLMGSIALAAVLISILPAAVTLLTSCAAAARGEGWLARPALHLLLLHGRRCGRNRCLQVWQHC